MITRKASALRSIVSIASPTQYICRRCLHQNVPVGPIPKPIPICPDPKTFLTLIGRQMSKQATIFPTWESLFTKSSQELKDEGLDPPRQRRYFLRWREKFRQGEFGVGGDFKYVTDGIAKLKICDLPSLPGCTSSHVWTPGYTRLILNIPYDSETYVLEDGQTTKDLKKPNGFRLINGSTISGNHCFVELKAGTKGKEGILKVTEGLWEHKRGHKVDGGERRKAEVRFKRRAEERKKERS